MRFDSLLRGIYDVVTLSPVRLWVWNMRWRMGARLMVLGTYIIPPTAARTVLCVHISTWALATQKQIIEFKQRELTDEIKRTTATWQET